MDFNPRTPYGVRPGRSGVDRAREDGNFNPRTPYGVRPSVMTPSATLCHFNPRTPYGVRQQKRTNFTARFCNSRQFPIHTNLRNAVCHSVAKEKTRIHNSNAVRKLRQNLCAPASRSATPSVYPLANTSVCSQNARFCFHISSPNSRTAGCPFPGP